MIEQTSHDTAIDDEVDRLCDEFESRWREGRPGRIEDYLSDATEPLRSVLLKELLLSELECRNGSGDAPTADDYISRFPQDRTLVESVLATATKSGDVAALTPGRDIDGYEVLHEIGRGGMGVVYKAHQRELDRDVALKVVLSGTHAGEQERDRFKREAIAAARLQHQHLVQVYDSGVADGLPWIAMEHVTGESLDRRLARSHAAGTVAMSPREAAGFVRTLAEAMHHAHEQNIVHRDLKPGNILIQNPASSDSDSHNPQPSSLNPKITDFGLAKTLDATGDSTRAGAMLGTPAYMAPEQAAAGATPIGPATDVHALGVILYELLTGRPPFRGLTVVETLEQVRNRESVPPRQLQPDTPRDLETICLKCLRKSPAQRYRSAQELTDDLGRFLNNEPIRARRTSIVERGWKWTKRRPLVAALLVAIAFLIVGGYIVITQLWLDARNARDDQAIQAEKAEEQSARRLIALARAEWSQDHIDQAKNHLNACPERFRNREWRGLHRVCFAEIRRIRLEEVFRCLTASLDLGRFVATNGVRTVVWDVAADRPLFRLDRDPVVRSCFDPDRAHLHVFSLRRTKGGLKSVAQLVHQTYDKSGMRVGEEQTLQPVIRYSKESSLTTKTAVTLRTPGTRTLAIIDLRSGKADRIRRKLSGRPRTLSHTGRFLAFASGYRGIKVFDTVRRVDLSHLFISGADSEVAFSFDERLMAVVYRHGKPMRTRIEMYFVADGKRLWAVDDPTNPRISRIAFSPDDRRIAVSGDGSSIEIRSVETGANLLTLRGHTSIVNFLQFNSDGSRLASASGDGTFRIWKVDSIDSP